VTENMMRLFVAFMDLKKVYDKVNRDGMWQVIASEASLQCFPRFARQANSCSMYWVFNKRYLEN